MWAARLGSQPLENWLLWESDGYPESAEVPGYRIWPLKVKGNFFGSYGGGIQNAPIPLSFLPKNLRDFYQNYRCRQSVASIEEILRDNKAGDVIQVGIGDDLARHLKVYREQQCVQTWAEASPVHLVELLNAVRNRILDFTLRVGKEAPAAGESSGPSTGGIDPGRVTQIFNMAIYGSANVVGTAQNSTISLT